MFGFLSTVVTAERLAPIPSGGNHGILWNGICCWAVALFTYNTKPSEASFTNHLTKNVPFGAGWLANMTIAKPTFEDWVFIRTATINHNNKSVIYVGVANRWFETGPTNSRLG